MTTPELRPWGEILKIQLFPYAHTQATLIRQIVKYTPPAGRILEVGFGSGWTSILLAQLGYEVQGIDKEWENVQKAAQYAECFGRECWPFFSETDLFIIGTEVDVFFDTGFSDGLFEHFTDEQVIDGLQIMKACCTTVIMDVPSWKERHTPLKRGDEIYRTNQEWRALIRRAGFTCKQMYGSVCHCPKWYRVLLPALLSKWFAPHFTTKVGFVL